MRAVKSFGVVVGVFIAWCIVAFIVMFVQRVGQVYDPTIDAWFVDNSLEGQRESAIWIGKAITAGGVVALGSGAFYWYRAGKRKVSASPLPPPPSNGGPAGK